MENVNINVNDPTPEMVDRVMTVTREIARLERGLWGHEFEEFVRWILADPGNRLGDALHVSIRALAYAAIYGTSELLTEAGVSDDRDDYRDLLESGSQNFLTAVSNIILGTTPDDA